MTLSAVKKFVWALLMFLAPLLLLAQNDDTLELTLEQNIENPEVPKRAKEYVRMHMDQLRRNLIKNGMEATPIRNGEALHVVLLCDSLFGPSQVELKPNAENKLLPLGIVVRDPSRYKLLVAVHTDDTGDEQYADSISGARANAIDDALWEMASQKDTNVVPYGIGKDEPLAPNTSRLSRSHNRRVEFFIIPDNGLLELAGIKRKK